MVRSAFSVERQATKQENVVFKDIEVIMVTIWTEEISSMIGGVLTVAEKVMQQNVVDRKIDKPLEGVLGRGIIAEEEEEEEGGSQVDLHLLIGGEDQETMTEEIQEEGEVPPQIEEEVGVKIVRGDREDHGAPARIHDYNQEFNNYNIIQIYYI